MEHHNEESNEVFCPAIATLDLLGGRWNLHIVQCLLGGKKRFNEIGREYGINPSTLRERLRRLEQEGVITRTVVSSLPPNVEYELTEKGRALNCILGSLAEWGRIWMTPPADPLILNSSPTKGREEQEVRR